MTQIETLTNAISKQNNLHESYWNILWHTNDWYYCNVSWLLLFSI